MIRTPKFVDRRTLVGGSDARIIMGDDEAALAAAMAGKARRGRAGGPVWQPHRPARGGYRGPEPALVRSQYRSGHHGRAEAYPASGPRLDGAPPSTAACEASGAVFEAKFMLPWSFSEEAAAEKYMPQLQHNMWVVAARTAVLSVITGGGKWVEIKTHADPLYQHLIVTAERKFWRCVESGETPALFRCRAAKAPDRGGPHCRHELVQCLGRIRRNIWDCQEFVCEAMMMGTEEHQMAIEKDLLDQLLAGRDPKEVFNKDGLVDELKKALSERILNAEIDEHLDAEASKAGAITATAIRRSRF